MARNILILTADAGFGHRSTALALARAFELSYGEQANVAVVNPLDSPHAPSVLRSAEGDYDKLASSWPEFYKLGYRMSDMAMTTSATEMAYVMLTYDLIAGLMRQHEPDVVVVTFPTYQSPIDFFRRVNGDNTPMATVITDLVSLQRMWFHKAVDLLLAPTEIAADLAVKNEIPAERVHVTGLPVNPALADMPASKAEARAALGWDPDLFTVLAVGSKRVEGLERFTHALNHAGFNCQIVAVAGGNNALYETWEQTEWHVPAHIYNFVSTMPDFLHAADCVLSKAGGLIVTESLACGLPLFIMQIIPGQETGNAQLVVREGAGDVTLEPMELLEAMAHWQADDTRLYRERAANAQRLGRPRAAYDAADLIWELAGTEGEKRPSRFNASVDSLKELLRQFKVSVTS
jgi:1,2-diacylglycerol 3-beta-galactosyltransferase